MKNKVGWTEKLAAEWHKYQPPSRPSKSEVKLYEKYIKKFKPGSKALILGSTPELRDLCAKYRFDTTICDWSQEIFEALKLLMVYKNAHEEFYKQDWRSMSIGSEFDLIVGDCATTVVPFYDLNKFLKKIADHLAIDGFALQRIWVRLPSKAFSLKDIADIYTKKPKNMHWYTVLLFPVFLHYYNQKSESLSGHEMYLKLYNDVKAGKVSKIIMNLFKLVKNHKTPNNVLLKKDLERMLGKYFRVVNVNYGKDNFSRNAPMYLLQKNSYNGGLS